MKIDKKQITVYLIILGVGLLMGYWIAPDNQLDKNEIVHEHTAVDEIWTCSMHPQIRKSESGNCPICSMELILVEVDDSSVDVSKEAIPMSEAAMALADIQTVKVIKQNPMKELRLLGKIKPDERLIYTQSAHISGRIERLSINFTGEKVRKGQKLASIYSPELVTAQRELFEVLKNEDTNPRLVEAARNKLKLWKFTDGQIAELEKKKKIQTEVDILSDYNGFVKTLNISEGDHVMQGESLIEITDLRKVWVQFEVYENDLSWIKVNDVIEMEIRALPGEIVIGKVSFIDPFIDPNTRVAYVRVELDNKNLELKPDMFVKAVVKSSLKENNGIGLIIPKSAILWTGKRSVVYVKSSSTTENIFYYREITLGEDVGDYFVVKEGLQEGEIIAYNGVFKIDAAAQLSGKKSMMNPKGNVKVSGHEGMEM